MAETGCWFILITLIFFQTDLLDMASKPAEHIKKDLEAVQESML